jgi:hypothetical protein
MEPVVNRLKDEYGNEVNFISLNANTDGAAAFEASSLRGHPAFLIVLPDGTETWRRYGIVPEDDIELELIEAIEEAIP